jgi:hypothetical protein
MLCRWCGFEKCCSRSWSTIRNWSHAWVKYAVWKDVCHWQVGPLLMWMAHMWSTKGKIVISHSASSHLIILRHQWHLHGERENYFDDMPSVFYWQQENPLKLSNGTQRINSLICC